MIMKTQLFRRDPCRGSALLAALIVIVVLTFAAAGVLSYSLTTYRNSVRQAILDQAKEVADSEMDYLYYCWKQQLQLSPNPVTAQGSLQSANVIGTSDTDILAGSVDQPAPFSHNMNQNWKVARFVKFDPLNTPDQGAQGLLQDTMETGENYYFDARTMAVIYNPVLGPIQFHSGRHFVFQSTSLFQFAVFYEGNLEIAAGGNMTIQGAVSTNASAYMGSQPGYTLTIADMVYYFQDYNGASDPLSGETDRLEGVGALSDPVFNPNPLAAPPANQAAQRALQVSKLNSQVSFINNVDVAYDVATYPTAYTDPFGSVDPNEVYRAVVAPPPLDALGNLIPEDPLVAASRMYNRAGLLITINQPTSGPLTVDYGYADTTGSNPTSYQAYTSTFQTEIAQGHIPNPVTSTRVLAVDKRELVNGTPNVELSTLDVGNLNDAVIYLKNNYPATIGNTTSGYNGLVYVYDNSNNTALGVPSNLNGILLANATTTPAFNDPNGNPLGFSVASNNGVFVQGDYNTTQITVGTFLQNNPAAIMADAVTALSQAWSPAESSLPILNRVAIPSAPTTDTWVSSLGTHSANQASLGTPTGMTVNAAILTGNTPSTATTNSGGVQNLVRMEEDWWSPQLMLTLDGSLGQLFTSDYFRGAYVGNSFQVSINDKVYVQPKTRNMDYDANFKSHAPNSTPKTTNFTRGDFYFW
jgi:type II secretory pathway pseudopilin PulG